MALHSYMPGTFCGVGSMVGGAAGNWEPPSPPAPPEDSFLLLESGDFLLLESGDFLILE
jgi:hypothetical protein